MVPAARHPLYRRGGCSGSRRTRRLLREAITRLDSCPGGAVNDSTVKRSGERWLEQSGGDVEVGYALLEAAARRIRDRCPAPAADDAAGLVLKDLPEETRGED